MKIETINGDILLDMFRQASATLKANKDFVNDLNVFPVPDGDTGTNMSMTFESAVNEMNKLNEVSIFEVTEAASNGSLMGARGNSGVILSQILRGFHKGCKGKTILTTSDFSIGLISAADTAYKAVMKPVEGTILTIIRTAADASVILSEEYDYFDEFLEKVIEEANKALAKTPEMLPVLKQAGVVDAGGQGLLYILKGFYGTIIGEKAKEIETVFQNKFSKQLTPVANIGNIEFGYCTEFIVKGTNLSDEQLKEEIIDFGDCMLVVGHEKMLKVHIHTNEPGSVMQKALSYGELIDIKIDNMRYQHNENHFSEEADIQEDEKPMKEYGVLSVAMGQGITEIFNDLNVDRIIEGGQTMNPSTEELLASIDKINAEKIIILPNNGNIILAAQQAKKISKKQISIVPTKTIPQGITAMLAFNPDADIDENILHMTDSIKGVKTIQITYSVRDSIFNGIKIKKGDILGIFNGDIVSVGKDINSVALEVLNKSIEEDDEIVTIYYGDSVEASVAEDLLKSIEKASDEIDVEIYEGKQPVYHYIISVE
ncbi:MAG: DAK2 domain-containing protein [Peptostreptococcaceae bacterium]|nr:DAK2 domain-containing protein [Peptostreptococcaceae bacterium]